MRRSSWFVVVAVLFGSSFAGCAEDPAGNETPIRETPGSDSGTTAPDGTPDGDAGGGETAPVGDTAADDTTPADSAVADSAADTGAADTGAADSGAADTGAADSGAADTGFADSGAVDTGFPDSGVADSGFADTGVADTGLADSGVADTGFADTGLADTGFADTGFDDTGFPDSGSGFDSALDDTGFLETGTGLDSSIGDIGVGADSDVKIDSGLAVPALRAPGPPPGSAGAGAPGADFLVWDATSVARRAFGFLGEHEWLPGVSTPAMPKKP